MDDVLILQTNLIAHANVIQISKDHWNLKRQVHGFKKQEVSEKNLVQNLAEKHFDFDLSSVG